MSNQDDIDPSGKPWYWHPERNRILVRDLRAGDVITGTGPSGDFEGGPVSVLSLVNATQLGGKEEFVVNLQGGGALNYWGATVVEIADRPHYDAAGVVRQ